jgi:hypothetical protein
MSLPRSRTSTKVDTGAPPILVTTGTAVQPVAVCPSPKGVIVGVALEDVFAGASDELVTTRPPIESVISLAPDKPVTTTVAEEDVEARLSAENVCAGSALRPRARHIARVMLEAVDTAFTFQHVIATPSEHPVLHRPALEHIVAASTSQHVAPRAPIEGIGPRATCDVVAILNS